MPESLRSLRRILAFVTVPDMPGSLLDSTFRLASHLPCERVTVLGGPEASEGIRRCVRARTGFETPPVEILTCGESDPVKAAVEESWRCDVIVTQETGMTTQRLLRLAPRSILSLPKAGFSGRGPVLVPVDFFDDSRRSVRFAAELAELEGSGIEILHVYSVPLGWHKLSASYVTMARRMRNRGLAQARADLDRFASTFDLARPILRRILRLAPHAAAGILDEARKGRHAQIVMAARRRGPFVSFLFGSVAERVVLSSPVPVWVIRDEAPLTWGDATS